jgi:hypothetical protein
MPIVYSGCIWILREQCNHYEPRTMHVHVRVRVLYFVQWSHTRNVCDTHTLKKKEDPFAHRWAIFQAQKLILMCAFRGPEDRKVNGVRAGLLGQIGCPGTRGRWTHEYIYRQRDQIN